MTGTDYHLQSMGKYYNDHLSYITAGGDEMSSPYYDKLKANPLYADAIQF